MCDSRVLARYLGAMMDGLTELIAGEDAPHDVHDVPPLTKVERRVLREMLLVFGGFVVGFLLFWLLQS